MGGNSLTAEPMLDALRRALGPENVLAGETDRLARARDASLYRLVPEVVVRPRDVAAVRELFAIARAAKKGVTFRAAGTSLSGQAVTDAILAELGPHWREARVSGDGRFVTAEPGVTGGRLNAMLARFHRRIGPDPASIASAMLGGIVANNASGMCCGTSDNAYRTLAGMKAVLASGYVLDSGEPGAAERFAREEPALAGGLAALRRRILETPALLARIREKYRLKNTMGYTLEALVDYERSLDIATHLLVGSEGTLGFIAEVTLATVAERAHKATAIAYFADLADAGAAVEPLAAAGADVVELMDRASLAALADEMHYPFALSPRCAALLVELHEDDPARLREKARACESLLARFPLLVPAVFTEDPARRAHYWKLRKGLFPKIGAERATGTSVIIEDVCVPRARLAEAVDDLRALFSRTGFDDAVIFGHAKDGNLHFVLCPDLSDPGSLARYARLMEGLARLVIDEYDGSLKAEHGTGRNMAPFVAREWGTEAHAIMREVKALFDPHGILNPGVLLTDDAEAHLRHLKPLPAVAERVDRCIECGFCETVCPSRDLTLTPRQRIGVQREIALLRAGGGRAADRAARALDETFRYAGVKTCAGDGLCASVCPVGIDTGAYMRELRASARGPVARGAALVAAKRPGWAAWAARLGLRLAHALRRLGLAVPGLSRDVRLPRPARPALPSPRASATPEGSGRARVVVFSACLGAVISDDEGGSGAAARVLERCGLDVIPIAAGGACCGQAFLSKGFPAAARLAAEGAIEALHRASEGGAYPVVCDTSPCTARLLALGEELSGPRREKWKALGIVDFPTFLARRVLPLRARWPRLERAVVVHPTCSAVKHGAAEDLVTVARAFASEVSVPVALGCCAFAGDKGFLVPELTRSATRDEAREVASLGERARGAGRGLEGYTSCETCALGMTGATGIPYRSIAELALSALDTGTHAPAPEALAPRPLPVSDAPPPASA